MRLLVATTNPNKIREIQGMLEGLDIDLIGLRDVPPVDEPEEMGVTFAANARDKARYYARATGLLAVAEDSGLIIDALGGEPGVHSARYGGRDAPDYPAKFALIYDRLAACGGLRSPARFVCALAVASGDLVLFESYGVIEGRIADAPGGNQGFGYDPIFFYPPLGRTLAEIDTSDKAAISHRGQAFRRLRTFLESSCPDHEDGQV
ncbi:MAG: RdgB/HAM1 family non-canonical purine NTP pyrophosphatase [Acidobacteriota bacterium]